MAAFTAGAPSNIQDMPATDTSNQSSGTYSWIGMGVTPSMWITSQSNLYLNETLLFNNMTGNNSINDTGAVTIGLPERAPSGLPYMQQVVLIILYTMAIVAAVSGNVLVIIVFTCGRRKTDLRPFLINLAVSDLVMAVFCMPFSFTHTMLGHWIFSPPMCPIVLFMQLLAVTASVSTNMAIGIDRFWVVTFPLKSRVTARRYRVVIAVIWVISVLLSSVQLAVGRAVPMSTYKGNIVYQCQEEWWKPQRTIRGAYTCFILAATYLLPLIILSLTYGIVGRKLWQRTAPGNKDASRDAQQLKSKRRVVKMLVIVVALFGACWMPLHVFNMVLDYGSVLHEDTPPETYQIITAFYYAVHWLAMSNSFVNPIIYGFLNDSFKADLFYLWRLWFPCCRCCPCVRKPALSRMMTSASQYRGYTRYTRQDSSSGSGSMRSDSKKLMTVKVNGRGKVEYATEMDARNSLLNTEETNGKHAAVV